MQELCEHDWITTHVRHKQAMRNRRRDILVVPSRKQCRKCGLVEEGMNAVGANWKGRA